MTNVGGLVNTWVIYLGEGLFPETDGGGISVIISPKALFRVCVVTLVEYSVKIDWVRSRILLTLRLSFADMDSIGT